MKWPVVEKDRGRSDKTEESDSELTASGEDDRTVRDRFSRRDSIRISGRDRDTTQPSPRIRFVDNEEIGRGESMREEARKKEWFGVKGKKEERAGKEVQIGEKIVNGLKEVEVVKEDRKEERIEGDQTEGAM
jgi:hypothetical protein